MDPSNHMSRAVKVVKSLKKVFLGQSETKALGKRKMTSESLHDTNDIVLSVNENTLEEADQDLYTVYDNYNILEQENAKRQRGDSNIVIWEENMMDVNTRVKQRHQVRQQNDLKTADKRFQSKRALSEFHKNKISTEVALQQMKKVNEEKNIKMQPKSDMSSENKPSMKPSLSYTVDEVFSKIRHDHLEEVATILADGYDANVIDRNGNNMLHICTQNNRMKMAILVIGHGCPINHCNNKGMSPLDYCQMYQFSHLAQWLEGKGARRMNMEFVEKAPRPPESLKTKGLRA